MNMVQMTGHLRSHCSHRLETPRLGRCAAWPEGQVTGSSPGHVSVDREEPEFAGAFREALTDRCLIFMNSSSPETRGIELGFDPPSVSDRRELPETPQRSA